MKDAAVWFVGQSWWFWVVYFVSGAVFGAFTARLIGRFDQQSSGKFVFYASIVGGWVFVVIGVLVGVFVSSFVVFRSCWKFLKKIRGIAQLPS